MPFARAWRLGGEPSERLGARPVIDKKRQSPAVHFVKDVSPATSDGSESTDDTDENGWRQMMDKVVDNGRLNLSSVAIYLFHLRHLWTVLAQPKGAVC